MKTLKRGFTLIELLVVVSIIALLIAILLPALGVARITAQRAACTANIKGMSFALTMYRQENNNANPLYLPVNFMAATPYEAEYFYTVQLAPYLNVVSYSNTPKKSGGGGQLTAFMSAIYNPFPTDFASKNYSVANMKTKSALFCPAKIVYEINHGWNDSNQLMFPTSDYACVTVAWARGVNNSSPTDNPTIAYFAPFMDQGTGVPMTNVDVPSFFSGLKKMQAAQADSTIATFGQFNSGASGPYGVYQSTPDATGGYVGYCWGYSSKTVVNNETTTMNMSHNDALPFSFLDGHAEVIKRGDIKDIQRYGHEGNGKRYGQIPLWSPIG